MLKVPVGSLCRRGDSWRSSKWKAVALVRQLIEIGQRDSTDAQVTRGLDVGAPVVLHPPDTLRDGVRVTERPAS